MELLIAIVMAGILMALAVGGFREFNQAMATKKAIRMVSSDLSLTRSYAIQRRSNVSLAADEDELVYRIRDEDGTLLATRSFGDDSGMPLTALDVKTEGDSVTFNSRGLLVAASSVQVEVQRWDRVRELSANALGRVDILPRQ